MNNSISVKIILFAVVALIIGLLTPIILYQQYPIQSPPRQAYTQASPTTSAPIPVVAPSIHMIKHGIMKSFRDYKELIDYLKNTSTIPSGIVAGISGIPYKPIPTVTAVYAGIEEKAGISYYTSTNVQVAGVDEPDIVKTNGKLIAVAGRDNTVYIIDTSRDEVVSSIKMKNSINSIYLTDKYLAVITVNYHGRIITIKEKSSGEVLRLGVPMASTIITVYDISDPEKPLIMYNMSISGSVFNSRLTNNTLYILTIHPVWNKVYVVPLVNDKPVPPTCIYLVGEHPGSYTNILALNLDNGTYTTYSFLINPDSLIYMSHDHLVLTSYNLAFSLEEEIPVVMNVLPKYLPSNITMKLKEYLARGEYASMSKLLNSYMLNLTDTERLDLINKINTELLKHKITDNTTLYILRVNGLTIKYVGKIDVPGRILDQFSIDEYRNRYLVVATTTNTYVIRAEWYSYRTVRPSGVGETITVTVEDSSGTKTYTVTETPIPGTMPSRELRGSIYFSPLRTSRDNRLTIIDLRDNIIVSRLTGIAVDEEIKTSRLVGDLFILVTYRAIDPLFAINISNPYKPEILGYLKIPGYNEYLHPLGNGLLLGTGVEREDLIVSIYNISDPRNIVEASKIVFKNTRSPVLSDYHAFTIDYRKDLVFIPLSKYVATYGVGRWDYGTYGIAVISYEDVKLVVKTIIPHLQASRTIVINDKVYTLSPYQVKIYNEDTLEEIGIIELK